MAVTETSQAPAPSPTDRSKAYLALLCAGLVAALAMLCIGGMMWNVFTGGPKPNGAGASTACRHYVEQALGEPSTARFSDLSLTGSGARWTVAGTISVRNGFGGIVDRDFACTVTGSGSNWSLVSLTGMEAYIE